MDNYKSKFQEASNSLLDRIESLTYDLNEVDMDELYRQEGPRVAGSLRSLKETIESLI